MVLAAESLIAETLIAAEPAVSPTGIATADVRKPDVAAGPRIHFTGLEYDFGTVKQGQKVSHSFSLIVGVRRKA